MDREGRHLRPTASPWESHTARPAMLQHAFILTSVASPTVASLTCTFPSRYVSKSPARQAYNPSYTRGIDGHLSVLAFHLVGHTKLLTMDA